MLTCSKGQTMRDVSTLVVTRLNKVNFTKFTNFNFNLMI